MHTWKVGDRGFKHHFGLQVSKKQNVSSSLTSKDSILWSIPDRDFVCSAADRQGENFESYVWRAVPSHSSHHPQEVLLAQFSLCVESGLKPHSFNFICGCNSFKNVPYILVNCVLHVANTQVDDKLNNGGGLLSSAPLLAYIL